MNGFFQSGLDAVGPLSDVPSDHIVCGQLRDVCPCRSDAVKPLSDVPSDRIVCVGSWGMSAQGGRTPSGRGREPTRRSPRLAGVTGAKPRISIQQLRKHKEKVAAGRETPVLEDPLAPVRILS